MDNGERSDASALGNGSFIERLIFNNRKALLILFAAITMVMVYQASQLRPEASFLRMIPTYHPYIQNFIKHQDNLKGLGNAVRISVETEEGDIFSAKYMEALRNVSDEVFFISGVDRGAMKSLWTPQARWTEVTEEGFEGGPIIFSEYDGSAESLARVRKNVLRSGEVGSLVANNFKSSIVHAPLLDMDPETGEPIDYKVFSERLEKIRAKFHKDGIKIHITGFAKKVGDLIDGASRVVLFFFIAFIVLLVFLYFTTRCARNTTVRAASALVAVIWQLGLWKSLGFGLNPYSMLVPFLTFALGVSHAIQMGNSMAHELMAGRNNFWAARLAFRKVYIPGLAALITDCIGFATLFVIKIGVIQDIAIGASIGVAVVVLTGLVLLPVLMSYTGINEKSLERLRCQEEGHTHPIWRVLASFASRKVGVIAIIVAVLGLGIGIHQRQGLKIGDLDPGAPELRKDSRYNLDSKFMTENYQTSSDVFVIMMETPDQGNSNYNALVAVERLQFKLRQVVGVQDTVSLLNVIKLFSSAYNEGNLKWMSLPRSQVTLDSMTIRLPLQLSNRTGNLSPILVFLDDHKAETLERVVATVEEFSNENNNENYRFLMAAGNAGIEAATNIEIAKAQVLMTALVYGVVFLVCMITYRSPRAAICVVTPLFLTSVLCEALMAKLGIGVKVATLPVIAVGVGIGVDYGIYIYNKLKEYLAEGHSLGDAYFYTLKTTGRAVIFTGTTLGIGVGTWAFSPIKFQADMGLLLTFMFVWNMIGALCLLPALVRFLFPQYARRENDNAPSPDVATPESCLTEAG
jgi:predicted RND superfamily exporter protein